MASPATPILTREQYLTIYDLLRLNPTADNEPIRREIALYLEANKRWATDANTRKNGTPW